MNCFYDPTQPAIGICKSCGKGLSLAFATDVGNGLACRDACEDRVRKINRMIDSNSKVMTVANTQIRRNTIFTIVMGVLFIPLGFSMGLPSLNPMAIIFATLGVVMILKGVLSYTRAARYPTSENPATSGQSAEQ